MVDKKNKLIKVGDSLIFKYQGKTYEGKVIEREDLIIMECDNNIPFSCTLDSLDTLTTDYKIKTFLDRLKSKFKAN